MSTSSSVSCWIRSLSSWSESEPRSGKVSIGRAYQRIDHTQAEVEGARSASWRRARRAAAAGAARVLAGGDERHRDADVDAHGARGLPAHEPGEQGGHDRGDREPAPP